MPEHSPGSISGLLHGLRSGASDAQRRLLREYWDVPYSRALRVLGSKADAHEVAMGVLGDFMVTHVHTFRATTRPALRLFVATVATRRALALRDRAAVLQAGLDAGLQPAPELETQDPWLLARLERCLRELPGRSRLILRLRYGQGLNNAEVAELLGQTRANVSKKLTHPLKGVLGRLRRCLLRAASAAALEEDR
ncbi:MAG: RNA polymerase sigma factor (sigma-70 family) [Myxococcota bacterium]|jgi:RNA polymerase sigma factor (sigma-70 family)